MKRALIVDDDASILALLTRWLSAAGYHVLTANSFGEARIEIRFGVPDIVIADIRLGEFNGIQLGILAREARSDVRLVIMSGWDDPVLRRDVDDLKATFLPKPLGERALLMAIGDPAAPEGSGTPQGDSR